MDLGAIIIIILISGLLVLTFYIIGLYNRVLDARNRVEDQFTQIDLEINKQIELVTDILEITKKYAKYEEKTINEVEKANKKLDKESEINGKINSLYELNKALDKIYNLREIYPELKSSRNLTSLFNKLNENKERIDYASSFYNDTVSIYNNLKNEPPHSTVAKVFKFKEIRELEINEKK